jgi:hypothetical protein
MRRFIESGRRGVGRIDPPAGKDIDVGKERRAPMAASQQQFRTVGTFADEDEPGGADRADGAAVRPQGCACCTVAGTAAAVMP